MYQLQPNQGSIVGKLSRAAVAIAVFAALLPAGTASAQVGQSLADFEKVSGKPIDKYKAEDGTPGLIYHDTWYSEKSHKQFVGRTAVEMGADNKVEKEVFFFDEPLPNTPDGAVDAVGIAFNLMPTGTPRKFVKNGRRSYEHGWVLWFDYGEGRYINFFLDQDETKIEAVVGGVEATTL